MKNIRYSTVQKELRQYFINDGKIENIGNVYKNNMKSARQTSNTTIQNFIDKLDQEFGVEVILGPRGGLGTATVVKKEIDANV